MKTTFGSLFLCLGLHAGVIAQNNAWDKVFDTYAAQEGYTTVYLAPALLIKLFTDGEENDKFSLQTVKILIADESVKEPDFYEQIVPRVKGEHFEELMRTRSHDGRSVMLFRKSDDTITDFLFVSGGNSNSLFYLQGFLPLSSLHKISDVAVETAGTDKRAKVDE